MEIRKAVPGDAAEAAALIHEAIGDIAEVLTGEKTEERIQEVLQGFFRQNVNRLSFNNCVAAVETDEICGIVVAYHGNEAKELDRPIIERLRKMWGNPELTVEKEAEPEDYYIDTLCVKREYRGKGFGSMLVEAGEQLAKRKGYTRVSLNVEEDNTGARRLYEKLGYELQKVITINGHGYDYMVKIL